MLGGVGLVILLQMFIQALSLQMPLFASEYGQYQHVVLNRAKMLDLSMHIGGVIALSVYYLLVRRYYACRTMTAATSGSRLKIGWLLVSGAIIHAKLVWRQDNPISLADWLLIAGLAAAWLMVNLITVQAERLERKNLAAIWRRQWPSKNTARVLVAFFGIAVIQLFFLFTPFVIGPLQLLNEYPDIPSTTILFEADTEAIDKQYYDQRQLMGPAQRYWPERDQGMTPAVSSEACLLLDLAPGLSTFLRDEANRNSFVYDRQAKRLCAVDSIMPEQWLALRMLASDEKSVQKIDEWYVAVRSLDERLQRRSLSRQEQQFFRVNQFSLGFQFSGMGVLHHHNFMLGPLNEYDLGKPSSEIYAQYGWLNLWLTHGLMKFIGGIAYQNYFRVWYSYYYLYYVLYFLLLWLLFRQSRLLAAGSLLAVGLLCFIDYQWLLQAPGINPIRRIMELPLIYGWYQYCKTLRRRYAWLCLLAIWLAILNNWQFGVMALVATGCSFVWFRWQRRQQSRSSVDAIWLAGSLACVGLLIWLRGKPDPLSAYYLAGIATLPLAEWKSLLVLLLYGLGAISLVRYFDCRRPTSYLCLFLLIYTAEVVTYSVWNATPTYLLVPGPLYVLLLLAFVQHFSQGLTECGQQYRRIAINVLIGLSVAFFLAGSWNHEKSRTEFLGLMESHQTFRWNLDRAKFISTMDPGYFADTVLLIQRYSADPSIYIISKYDNFAPFLARKYSAMPYFELTKFLISPRESAECVQRILQDKPEILFVDTDINRDFASDVVHRHAPLGKLNGLSRYHADQMRSLQRIFQAVQADYQLIEQGMLISVYQRRK